MRPSLRAYLLLEAGIAGGMAAAVLAGLLVQLASAQTQATLRARHVTSQAVAEAVAQGADTTKKVAAATGAGSTCGRCKATVRQIIAAVQAGEELHPSPPKRRAGRWI